MTIKVLHIFGIMNRGGAELRTLSTMEWMKNKGVHYDFVALSGQEGVLDKQIIEQNGKIYYCKLNTGFVKNFVKLLKSEQYDVVHSHVSLVSGLINLIALCCGVKIRISHFRSTRDVENPSLIRKCRDVLLRFLTKQCSNKILAVCEASLDAFFPNQWRNNKKFNVIYNGFPQIALNKQENFWSNYLTNYQEKHIIVNVARMDEPKNHVRMANIFAQLCEENRNALFVLIGKEDDQIKAEMDTIIAKHDINNRVFFLGEQSNVIPFLMNADLMFFPSKWEGLPGAVIESSSVGTRVLGSDIPGIVEISQRIDSVQTMKLSAHDTLWASKLNELLSVKFDRFIEQEKFNQSEFQFSRNVEQLYAVYAVSK